jgi:hypothetical protein
MKKSFFFLAVSFLALHSTLADWKVVQKTTTDGQVEEVNIKIKGDMTRMDVGQQMSIIADGAASSMVMLMHAQKVIMKMDAESLKAMMAMASGALGGNTDKPAAKPVATGQKEKVGEYDCEIFTWTGQMGTGKFWVAKDFPGHQELNAAQDKMMKALGNPAAALSPQASDFPGMVIKADMQVMGKSSVSELVSAKQESVDASAFAMPQGYQEMKMPTMPGQ